MRGRHRRDPLVERHQRVEHDEAITAVQKPLELVARLFGQDDQRAVAQAVEPVEDRDLTVVLAARGREHDLQAPLGERLGRSRENAREVRGIHERDEDSDQPRATGGEAAGTPIRRVAVLADDSANEVAGLVRDVLPAVEDAGDGGDRNPRLVGDVPDRRASGDVGHGTN